MKAFLGAYFLAVFFFLTFFSSGFVDSQDGLQYLTIARRIYFDQTFEMPPTSYPETNIHMGTTKTADGRVYSPTGLGFTLALLPAVAFEDVMNRLAGVEPIVAFPLQNDWPVLLVASMTNAFFGAVIVVTLYAYLRTFTIKHTSAVAYSLLGVIATNLFPYTKHVFPHAMFVSSMLLVFYWLRRFGLSQKRWHLALAGVSFGLLVISYNPTFLLTLPAMALYYFFQRPVSFAQLRNPKWWLAFVFDILTLALNAAPFALLYLWFNWVRFGGGLSTGYGTAGIPLPPIPPAYVMFEGFWSLLFSPGKSIFLFSPVLVLLVTHWFKLGKKWRAEIVAATALFITYFYFIGTLLGDVDFLLWHGESSWGPRYMLPTIPLLYLLVVGIVVRFKRWQKVLIFLPLVLIGVGVQLVGMLQPYQIRFRELKTDVMINDRNFTVYEYGNQIPRYSPVFNMAKKLAYRLKNYRTLYGHGVYNVRLRDGFVRPFYVPGGFWREPLNSSAITFDQTAKNPVERFEFQLRNHQIDLTSSASATLSMTINGKLLENPIELVANEEEVVSLPVADFVQPGENKIVLTKQFNGVSNNDIKKQQVIFLQNLHINGQPQPIGGVDFPYVSQVSAGMFGVVYDYYGNTENTPWEIWHLHSGVFEETLDLWWLRPFHLWDLPARWFATLFVINFGGLLFFSGLAIVVSVKSRLSSR